MNMFSLSNKIAIVTGGSGLYGRPICEALVEAGATVIIASRNQTKCKYFAEELKQKNYIAEAMSLDLSDENSIISMVNTIVAKYGTIDILINNAVSREGFRNIEDITKEEWESSQRVNSTGTMLITKAVLSVMKKQKSGNIINISSIQGMVGPNFPVYGDTGMTSPINYTYDKWGIIGFTKWIANYYASLNIRANCISPASYGPEVKERKGIEEFIENYQRLTPMRRFADDNDIKGPIVFLASAASAFITGHNLPVDGGWTNW